ncbi:efflux RND transporter periplasmic adaptor subunit [Mariniflexile aquimaris]|uniref:Efflux RND transporter periplasmic adaptor subunit n=1 Tax=Mariniflexile aquimaris TaxID=881009 RepID=A0ABW3BP14_9FLAO
MKNIYILFISLAFVACGNSEKNNESTSEADLNSNTIVVTPAQFKGEGMQLGTLQKQDFNGTVKTNGMIDVPPSNKANVSTFMGGYITKTPLLIGDKVKKGQLLVTLENPEFVELQQQYLEIAEQLNYLKSEFERQKTLHDENITSQKNFLKAESTYKSSLAHYNGLQKKLKMLNINPTSVEQGQITSTVNIYAPIEGYITKVNVSNGTYVSPADTILEIIDTAHIHLELIVFEKDILNIKKGQKINFKIPEASAKTFEAEVHLVGTSIDATNRTVKIHGHIKDEKEASFIVGMFVEAEIVINNTNSFALPNTAVAEIEGDYFALVLESKSANYTFNKTKINVGKQTENYIEVLNYNDFSDKQVLTNGSFMLLSE